MASKLNVNNIRKRRFLATSSMDTVKVTHTLLKWDKTGRVTEGTSTWPINSENRWIATTNITQLHISAKVYATPLRTSSTIDRGRPRQTPWSTTPHSLQCMYSPNTLLALVRVWHNPIHRLISNRKTFRHQQEQRHQLPAPITWNNTRRAPGQDTIFTLCTKGGFPVLRKMALALRSLQSFNKDGLKNDYYLIVLVATPPRLGGNTLYPFTFLYFLVQIIQRDVLIMKWLDAYLVTKISHYRGFWEKQFPTISL